MEFTTKAIFHLITHLITTRWSPDRFTSGPIIINVSRNCAEFSCSRYWANLNNVSQIFNLRNRWRGDNQKYTKQQREDKRGGDLHKMTTACLCVSVTPSWNVRRWWVTLALWHLWTSENNWTRCFSHIKTNKVCAFAPGNFSVANRESELVYALVVHHSSEIHFL